MDRHHVTIHVASHLKSSRLCAAIPPSSNPKGGILRHVLFPYGRSCLDISRALLEL